MTSLLDLARRFGPQLSRYTVVSLVALCVDLAIYRGLTVGGARAVSAGVVAYLIGGVVHYVLSAQFVFDVAASSKPAARRFGEFWLSGVLGLAITAGMIWIGADLLKLPPMLAKLAAVGFSFVAMYIVRRNIVFAQSA